MSILKLSRKYHLIRKVTSSKINTNKKDGFRVKNAWGLLK